MRLTVRHAAELLHVSTKTIYRWIADGKIPAYRVNNSLRFDLTELTEWADANRITLATPRLDEPEEPHVPGLDDALLEGGIHYRVEGATRDEVLTNAVGMLRLQLEDERERVLQALLAREALASTAIGDEVALPHLRNPVRFHFHRPSVTLCFLDQPVDWRALDGNPVSIVFITIGPTVRSVLQLHSRVYFALRDAEFRAAILGHASREVIMTAARRVSADQGRR